MREIKEIIIHCSDSPFGDWSIIDKWHKARGWDSCGYHFIILNGITKYAHKYAPNVDGYVENGRPVATVGAHCYGQNQTSIGICLIGRNHFTSAQLFESLPMLLLKLLKDHNLSFLDIWGHCEFNANKTCPNFNVGEYRKFIEARVNENINPT